MGPLDRVFVPGKPFWQSVMKYSSLLCPFLSYEEKEIADILHVSYSQQFLLLMNGPIRLECLYPASLSGQV